MLFHYAERHYAECHFDEVDGVIVKAISSYSEATEANLIKILSEQAHQHLNYSQCLKTILMSDI